MIESPQWSCPPGPGPGGTEAQRWGATEEICLVEVTDAADQLAHWVAEEVFVENDATRRGFYHSLCGRVLLPAAMTVGPRGACRGCLAVRAELERHAAARAARSRHRSKAQGKAGRAARLRSSALGAAGWTRVVDVLARLGARARHRPPTAAHRPRSL